MAVKSDTASNKTANVPVKKSIAVTYISDDESAAHAREVALKNSPGYQHAVQERRKNTLLSQDLLDRAAARKKRALTFKEAKLIKGIVAGKKRRDAARAAGIKGSDEVVSATTSRMLKNVNVKIALQEALQNAGVGVDNVADVIAAGMVAEDIVVVGSGDSTIVEKRPDHSIRLRAAGMAAKYLGAEEKEDDPNKGSGNTFNFINNANFNSKNYVSDATNVQEGETA